jgi:hypothetical protein
MIFYKLGGVLYARMSNFDGLRKLDSRRRHRYLVSFSNRFSIKFSMYYLIKFHKHNFKCTEKKKDGLTFWQFYSKFD